MSAVAAMACGVPAPVITAGETFGEVHSGSYHLGPVDWEERQFNNSCSPYPAAIQSIEGRFLAGVDNTFNGNGQLCDACALVTTRLGKSVLVRIVTTGVSNAPGDMDLSQEAYQAIHEDDPQGTSRNPRPMTWQLAKCPASSGPLRLQYQTGANAFWTSLWVRVPRVPLQRVEVQRARDATFTALQRGTDGTWTEASGFGSAAFTLRLTSIGGVSLSQTFSSFQPGALVETTMQFE
jgi:hypothetical protein